MDGSAIAVIREVPSMIKARGRSGTIRDASAVLSTMLRRSPELFSISYFWNGEGRVTSVKVLDGGANFL